MTARSWTLVAVLWLLSLAGTAGVVTYAQVPQPAPAPPGMISGADIGFMVEDQKGGVAFGRLMVRVDGQWREAAGSNRRGFVVPIR